jgi:hypothetical protein
MYLRFRIFKVLPSSSLKLYLLHFKTLLWCFLKTNFCHSNFAKLLHTHMTLIDLKFWWNIEPLSTTLSQNFSSFNFKKWEILSLHWSHLKLGPEHKMTYNSLSATPKSLRFWETHKIYVLYICSKFQPYWWWPQRDITFKRN